MKLPANIQGENKKTFDIFMLLIHQQIITSEKPKVKTSSSIELKL